MPLFVKNHDDCCSTIIGGRVEVRMYTMSSKAGTPNRRGQGRRFYGIGDARIQPQMFERTAGMTNNGKLWVTVAPRAARLLMDYMNDCRDAAIWEMIDPKLECKLSFTVQEIDRGVTHRFNNAAVVGFAEINLSTGVITGLEVVADQYTVDPAGRAVGVSATAPTAIA